ncbi:MAG: HAD-IC family P-type ATPase [Deltaproteobacteria bacterium]|nr:HAD-IC family P-type ATPase [Deltaproteobacteria bacterium]
MEWHQKPVRQVAEELQTDPQRGLSPEEARLRLQKFGPNALLEKKREPLLKKFPKQFTEFIILVLIGAAIIAGLLGEWIDMLAIMAIVVLNGVIGFIQEEKAERVMEALKKLSAPSAKVLRGGELKVIPAKELVPGDVVALESGDNLPADCRIIDSKLLKVQEAPLTGESHPIEKGSGELENTLPLADRTNMAYSGTTVVYGRGKGVIIATGMATEMGKIAKMLQEVKPEPTPLQKRLAEFGRFLVYAAGGICALIFLIGVVRGEELIDMFLIAVSLAVAAIPEGLPAVVTIVLALGVQRMVRRHALIRKLPSVETLGSATIIASDKTGTLTQNQMTVKRLFLSTGETITVSGTGYSPEGHFLKGSTRIRPQECQALILALKTGALCNSAELKKTEDSWTVIGDPTEGALLTLGLKAGLKRDELEKTLTHTGEVPFDAERKMMTSIYKEDEKAYYAFVKGAPERILLLCSFVSCPSLKYFQMPQSPAGQVKTIWLLQSSASASIQLGSILRVPSLFPSPFTGVGGGGGGQFF